MNNNIILLTIIFLLSILTYCTFVYIHKNVFLYIYSIKDYKKLTDLFLLSDIHVFKVIDTAKIILVV